MTTFEKEELKKEKLNWRERMRAKYGLQWTKSFANRMQRDGFRRMN